MVARRGRRAKISGLDTLTSTITDAVKAASKASDSIETEVRNAVYGKSGLPVVFAAARKAVANTEPGNTDLAVFDEAMRGAMDGLADSSIPSNYDRMREVVMTAPSQLIWMAARQAAGDLFATMPAKAKGAGDGRLLGKMKSAAVRAAKTRLGRKDRIKTVEGAVKGVRYIAEGITRMTSEIVMTGAATHAATAAVFEVTIRNVRPEDLRDAVEEACIDLPRAARRHDDVVVGLVAALATMIAEDASNRRKYQTAARGAVELSQEEAAGQVFNMITGNAFQGAYVALVAGAYATSDGSDFESGYERALAKACGVDTHMNSQLPMGSIPDDAPPDIKMLPEDLYRRLSSAVMALFTSDEDIARQRRFNDAMDADYKAIAARREVKGIITMYEMAYRAGYKAAAATAGCGPGKE